MESVYSGKFGDFLKYDPNVSQLASKSPSILDLLLTYEESSFAIHEEEYLDPKICLKNVTVWPYFMKFSIMNLEASRRLYYHVKTLRDYDIECLDLSNMQLFHIEEDIFQYHYNIQRLILSGNTFYHFPNAIRNLKFLQEIDFSANRIKSISSSRMEWISKMLPKLTSLIFDEYCIIKYLI